MDLKDQGKIRAIGVSNILLDQHEAYRVAGDLASNQFRSCDYSFERLAS